MATTPIDKYGALANNTGVVVYTNEEDMEGYDGWEPITPGANNGATFAFIRRDAIFLQAATNTSVTFTLLTPNPDGFSSFGATLSDPTIVVAANNSVKMVRLSDDFRGAGGLVTIEANTTGGQVMVIPNP